MPLKTLSVLVISCAILFGCVSTGPMTFEEKLNSTGAKKSAIGESAGEFLNYDFVFAYAETIRQTQKTIGTNQVSGTTKNPQLVLSIASLSQSVTGLGVYHLFDWLGTNMAGDYKTRHAKLSTAPAVNSPNVHYISFALTDGTALTQERLVAEHDRAVSLFNKLYESKQYCIPLHWKEDTQYRWTNIKNVEGLYRLFEYECFNDAGHEHWSHNVSVATYANPSPDLDYVSIIQLFCPYKQDGDFIDSRECGRPLAAKHNARISDEDKRSWMQMVVAPSAEHPGDMMLEITYQNLSHSVKSDVYSANFKKYKEFLSDLVENDAADKLTRN